MFKIFIQINLIILFLTSISLAEIIKEIKVTGNKRLSKETIIVFGEIDYVTDYSEDDLNNILKRIYETKFFKKIVFDINNSILSINVVENPIIESLEINGIKSSKLNELLLEKINLKSRKSFVETLFLSDLNLIKNIIKSSGYYFAKIKTTSILNDEQNSIRLTFDVDLGKRAKIN